ncbi:uncharacterized protein LOC135342046 [Halichondria panicea]|uniref:uncharacterized protein LOC135342046 n=1 Tax=Halichondria panicea TaxID=6063 RepID=UPI00312B5AB1
MSEMSINTHISRDYSYYHRWTFLFPLVTLLVVLGLSVLAIVISALFRKALSKYTEKTYDELRPQHICLKIVFSGLRDMMLRTTKFLLFEFEYEKVEKNSYRKSKEKKFEYRLYGVPVHLFVLQYLFIVLLSILAVSILSLWNIFIAESSLDECSTLYDCFPIFRENSTPIETDPITDCDDFSITENTTVLCYRVVYRYSEGLGEAGGFLFSMQVITNVLIYFVVRIFRTVLKVTKIVSHRNLDERRERTLTDIGRKWPFRVSRFAKVLAMSITLILHLIVLILLPVWVLHQREDFLVTIKRPQRKLQLAFYANIIFVLFLVPLIVGTGIYGKKTYEKIRIEYKVKETFPEPRQNQIEIQIDEEPNADVETCYQNFNGITTERDIID